MESAPRYETVMRILETLPGTMTLGDALTEAQRIKREADLAKDRIRVEEYRKAHMDQKRARDRAYRARKKEKLQAVSALEKSQEAPDKNIGVD